MNSGVTVLSVVFITSVRLFSLSCFVRRRLSAFLSAFESCLNRSVLIRVIRSNLPQIERKSMAWASYLLVVFSQLI